MCNCEHNAVFKKIKKPLTAKIHYFGNALGFVAKYKIAHERNGYYAAKCDFKSMGEHLLP